MKNILIATIGTRDLMFQISAGEWYNVGDDQMQDGEIIGEQAEVLADLGFAQASFRELTQYFLENLEQYRSRLKPVIIGKLLADQAQNLERIYLIGTDQKIGISQRKKDTVYACELIKGWLMHNYAMPVEVITLGENGENPSNFEQMFRWWQQVWRETIQPQPEQPILLCLKGCVAQTAEAGRISGLSAYGDRIQFFDFIQNTEANRKGIPSEYIGPILGSNYLWDRTQQQALKLLDRYDYAGVEDLLLPYFRQDSKGFKALPNQIKAGIAWSQGQFGTFLQLTKSLLTPEQQQQGTKYWWVAYEQAQLALIRLQQQNTTEAMLSSFRAVEGLLWLWAIEVFPKYVRAETDQYPILKQSICQKYPKLCSQIDFNRDSRYPNTTLLQGKVLRSLLEVAIPETAISQDFKEFWDKAKTKRNTYSHRLGGLTEREVFNAWGEDIRHQIQWETRILTCLNLVTGQTFKNLQQASLFHKMHIQVRATIAHYRPSNS
jgi:hypothetical protein